MSGFSLKMGAACLALICLASCGKTEQTASPPITRPVKTIVVEGGSGGAVRTFPGRVDATQRAELAFRVPGQVQEILVREGDLVEAGEVLARLDPTDYELVLEDRQATYDNARSNFERGRGLITDGNISRMDYDRMEANFRTSSAALSKARKDLEYTVLVSPFRGRIAQRRVENFEEILAKQTIIWLQNIDQLDVIIDVPESIVRTVRRNAIDDESLSSDAEVNALSAFARFEGQGEDLFFLTPKEISTKADAQTQTFRATFTMEAPSAFTVLPGMTATVSLDFSSLLDQEQVKWVPVRAVQADSGLKPRVWVLQPDTMTVSAQAVTVGRMSRGMIEVIDGLQGGEEIVAVGAPYLAEGMRVTRMQLTEQAVPRDSDPI